MHSFSTAHSSFSIDNTFGSSMNHTRKKQCRCCCQSRHGCRNTCFVVLSVFFCIYFFILPMSISYLIETVPMETLFPKNPPSYSTNNVSEPWVSKMFMYFHSPSTLSNPGIGVHMNMTGPLFPYFVWLKTYSVKVDVYSVDQLVMHFTLPQVRLGFQQPIQVQGLVDARLDHVPTLRSWISRSLLAWQQNQPSIELEPMVLRGGIYYALFGIPMYPISFTRSLEVKSKDIETSYKAFSPYIPEFNVGLKQITKLQVKSQPTFTELEMGLVLNNTSPYAFHLPSMDLPFYIDQQRVFLFKLSELKLSHAVSTFQVQLQVHDLTGGHLDTLVKTWIQKFEKQSWLSMEIGMEGPIHMALGGKELTWIRELTSNLSFHIPFQRFLPILLSDSVLHSTSHSIQPHLVVQSDIHGIQLQIYRSLPQFLTLERGAEGEVELGLKTTVFMNTHELFTLALQKLSFDSKLGVFHSATLRIAFFPTTFQVIHDWVQTSVMNPSAASSSLNIPPPFLALGNWQFQSVSFLSGFQFPLNPFFSLSPSTDLVIQHFQTLLSKSGGVHVHHVQSTMEVRLDLSSFQLPFTAHGHLPISLQLGIRRLIQKIPQEAATFATFQLTPILQGTTMKLLAQLNFINDVNLQTFFARLVHSRLDNLELTLNHFHLGKCHLHGALSFSLEKMRSQLSSTTSSSISTFLNDLVTRSPSQTQPLAKKKLESESVASSQIKDTSCLRLPPTLSVEKKWTPHFQRVVVQTASMGPQGAVQVDLYVEPPFWLTQLSLLEFRASLNVSTIMTLVRFESLPIEYRASQRQSLKFTLFMLPEWQLLQSFLQQYLETSSFPRVSMTFTELQWGSIQTLRLMAFPLVSSNSSTTQLLRYVPEVLDFIQFRWGVNIPSQATRMSAYAHGHLPSLPFEYLIHLPLHMQVHLHDPKLSSKEPVMELSAHLFMSSCQNEALADVHLHFFNSSQVQARWREFFSPESSTMIVVNGIRLNPRPTTEETKPWMSMQWSSILKVLSKSSLDSILQLPQHINVYTLPNGIQIDTLLQPSMFPYLQSISWASVSALVQLVGSNAAAQVQILPGHLQGSQSDDISPSEKTISIQFSFVDLSFGTSTSFWTDEPWGIQLSHLKIGEIHSFSKAEVIHQFTFPTSEPNKFEEWSTFLRDIQIEFHSKLPKLTLSIDLVRPSLPFSWSLHLPSQWKVFLQTNGDRFSTPFILVQSELKCQSDQPSPILIDVWISQEPTVQLALATLMDQFLHSKQPDIKFSIAGLQFGRSKIFKKMELVSTHLTSLNSLRSTFTHSSLPRKPEGIRLTRLASAPSTLQLEFDLTLPVNDWHLSRIAFPNIRFWLKFQHQRLLPIFIPAFDVDPMTKMTFAIQLEMDNIQLHPVQQLLDKLPGVIPNSYLGLEDVQVGVMKAFQKITFDERVVLPSDQGHAPFPLQNVEFQEIPSGLEMQAELHLPWGLTTLLDVSTLFPLSIHVKRSSTTLLLAQWHTLTLQSPFILHFRVSVQAPELSSTTSLKDMNQFVNEIITHTGLASLNVTGLTLGAAAPTPIRSLQSLHFVTSINSFSDTPSNKSCPFQPAVRPPSLPLPPSDPTLINRATTFFIRMSEDGLPGFDISIRSFFPFQMKWLKSPLVIKKISLQLQLNNHDFVHVSLSEFTLSGKLNALVAPTLYVRFGTSEPLQKDLSKLVLEVLSYLRRTTEEFHFTQFNVRLTGFEVSSFQTWKSVHAILPLDSILPKVLCELHPFFVIDSLYSLDILFLVATIHMPINIGIDLENIKTYLYLSGKSSGEIKIPKVYKKIGDAFSIVDSNRINHGTDYFGLLNGGIGFLHSLLSYSRENYGSLKGIFFRKSA